MRAKAGLREPEGIVSGGMSLGAVPSSHSDHSLGSITAFMCMMLANGRRDSSGHNENFDGTYDENDQESSSPSITPPHCHEVRERRACYFDVPTSNAPRPRSAGRINVCEEALHELKASCGPFSSEIDTQPREAFINVIERLTSLDESIKKELDIQEKMITECCLILNQTAVIDMVAHSGGDVK